MDMDNYSPESNIDRKTPTKTIKKFMRVTNSWDNLKLQCTMGQSTTSEVPFTFLRVAKFCFSCTKNDVFFTADS